MELNIKQATKFYETLARIIAAREGVEITAKVKPAPRKRKAAAAGA